MGPQPHPALPAGRNIAVNQHPRRRRPRQRREGCEGRDTAVLPWHPAEGGDRALRPADDAGRGSCQRYGRCVKPSKCGGRGGREGAGGAVRGGAGGGGGRQRGCVWDWVQHLRPPLWRERFWVVVVDGGGEEDEGRGGARRPRPRRGGVGGCAAHGSRPVSGHFRTHSAAWRPCVVPQGVGARANERSLRVARARRERMGCRLGCSLESGPTSCARAGCAVVALVDRNHV